MDVTVLHPLLFCPATDETRDAGEERRLLQDLIRICRPSQVRHAFRSIGVDQSWNDLILSREQEEEVESAETVVHLPAGINPSQLADFFVAGRSLLANFGDSSPLLCDRVYAGVESGVPLEVRGRYLPWDLSITVGEHDLFDSGDDGNGRFYGRASLSIEFGGNHTPHDWTAFRRLVFSLPEIQAVQHELEAATGPLSRCVLLDG